VLLPEEMWNAFGAAAVVALVASCGSVSAPRAPRPTADRPIAAPTLIAPDVRLPRTFEPTGYRVRIALEVETLRGSIEIVGKLAESTRVIWLHGDNIVVAKAVARSGTKTIALAATAPRRDTFLALYADEPLPAGTWTLALDYTGKVDNKGVVDPASRPGKAEPAFGVFSEQLDDRRYWFTNSEPTFARRIFPCFDEPDRKVPWQLTLDVPTAFVAASNTPIVRETPLAGDHKRVEFAATPPLPSYLVAFATGPFEIVDGGKSRSGVPIRILGLPGRTAGATWALHVTRDILARMEDFTAIPYPYQKLDFVAVPRTGTRWIAMENPGLITFGTQYLPAKPSLEPMWRLIAGHELAHQWFGNLVTPAWWNDVWLNESFAVWLQNKIEKQVEPGAAGQVFDAFRRSWELTSRLRARAPMDDTRDPDDIAPYMDGYRGEPIVRMFEEVAGQAAFQRAVRAFLAKHSHGTATAADFATALDTSSGQSLRSALEAYLDRSGAPALEPTLECGTTEHHVTLRHKAPGWPVPACFAYDADGTRGETCAIVSHATTRVPLPATRCPRWVMANANATGLYTIDWKTQLDPLLEHGWPLLTEPERLMLLAEMSGSELASVALASRLLASPEPTSRGTAAHALAMFEQHVPDDLVAAFRARVLAAITRLPTPLVDRDYPELGESLLAGLAGHAAVGRDAVALVDRTAKLPGPVVQVVLRVATTIDPRQLDRLFAGAKVRDHTRWHVVDAIARSPVALERFEREPQLLASFDAKERLVLLTTRCDPSRQARVMALATKAFATEPDVVKVASDGYNKCLDRRAKLAPVFRAWLKRRA
jgi:alanyl aminopeptidase